MADMTQTKFMSLIDEYNALLSEEDKGYRLHHVNSDDSLLCFDIVLANSKGLNYNGRVSIKNEEVDILIEWFRNIGNVTIVYDYLLQVYRAIV